jgi:hypothetical protein
LYVYSYILLVDFIVDITGRELSGGATLITEFRLIQIVRRTEEEKKKNFQSLDVDGDGKIDQDEVDISIIQLF